MKCFNFPRRLLRSTGLALFIVLGLAYVAAACNVPVFRYALERWRPAPYRITLLHRGALTEAEQALAARLAEQEDTLTPAWHFRRVDADTLDDEADAALIGAVGDPKLPAIVAQYPEELGIAAPFWVQPLQEDSIGNLIESPARKELVRRLADGQTGVWLVLECGDQAKDDAAAKLLEQELERLEKELELPDLTDAPEDELQAAVALRIEFSVLRIARNDAEAALVAMLLYSEPDLAERSEPLIFPIFGRGRALFPLVGAGITVDNIASSAAFLVGACSCEIKEQNPGFDLLLAADWDELVRGQAVTTADFPPATANGPPEFVAIPAGSITHTSAEPAAPPAVEKSSPNWKWLVGGSLLGMAAVAWWWCRR